MCVKKIYYNTYADGAHDITEEIYPCREGMASHAPEVRKYDRKLPHNKSSRFLGDLPTPRRSKSPSPLGRRESAAAGGPADGSAPKHYGHRDRSDRHDRHDHHRRSSRHLDAERDLASSPGLKRSLTSPHSPRLPPSPRSPHYVVIDQDQSRFQNHDIPLGPVHVANETGGHRRHSSRDHDSSNVHVHRRNSVNPQSYVVINDHREHRRHERKRRMSTTEVPPAAPPAPDVRPAATSSRRPGLRRAATVVQSSDSSNAPSTGTSPPKHVHWEEKLRMARDKHNAEINKRDKIPDGTQEPPIKGILKRATTGVWRGKGRDNTQTQELRRAVERMDLPTSLDTEELDLYDRDRLKARFGPSDESERERRRRSKVWVAGDRYQYL